jgi:RimJ/RimL family protein N-acetyltransferase
MDLEYSKSHPNFLELEIPRFTQGRLKLIEPKTDYAKTSLSWTTQPEIVQYMGGDFSNPSLEKEVERLKKIIETTDEYNWMIELDDRVIGAVGINKIQAESERLGAKAGDLVILIGEKQHWRKGIGHNVLQTVLDWAFGKSDFKIITARALKQNLGSLKTLAKLGLEKIGESPYKDGLIDGKPATWANFRLGREKHLRK